MKKISELGISPWPWHVGKKDELLLWGHVVSSPYKGCDEGRVIATTNKWFDNENSDARLISASPELYECLREAVVESCHECEDDTIENCRGKCFVAKWRDALAKAVMESEMNKQ